MCRNGVAYLAHVALLNDRVRKRILSCRALCRAHGREREREREREHRAGVAGEDRGPHETGEFSLGRISKLLSAESLTSRNSVNFGMHLVPIREEHLYAQT